MNIYQILAVVIGSILIATGALIGFARLTMKLCDEELNRDNDL